MNKWKLWQYIVLWNIEHLSGNSHKFQKNVDCSCFCNGHGVALPGPSEIPFPDLFYRFAKYIYGLNSAFSSDVSKACWFSVVFNHFWERARDWIQQSLKLEFRIIRKVYFLWEANKLWNQSGKRRCWLVSSSARRLNSANQWHLFCNLPQIVHNALYSKSKSHHTVCKALVIVAKKGSLFFKCVFPPTHRPTGDPGLRPTDPPIHPPGPTHSQSLRPTPLSATHRWPRATHPPRWPTPYIACQEKTKIVTRKQHMENATESKTASYQNCLITKTTSELWLQTVLRCKSSTNRCCWFIAIWEGLKPRPREPESAIS